MSSFLAQRRKLLAYLAGVLAAVIALGVLHGQVLIGVEIALALITGGGIHQAGNADPPGKRYHPANRR